MKYYLFAILVTLAIGHQTYANDLAPIDLDVDVIENINRCAQNPETPATYSNSIEAGWAVIGLGDVIVELKFLNPETLINDLWSYGPFSRKVTVRISGKCRDVKKAAIMFESIRGNR